MSKETKKRVYVVPIAGVEYLARATTMTQAARYTAFKLGGEPRLATQDDLIRLIGGGGKIIEAPVDAQKELELAPAAPSAADDPMTADEEAATE